MRIINILFVAIIIGITAFFSVFSIGSYEQHLELIDKLPLSFISRLIGVSIIGLIGLAFLVLVNFLLDKIVYKRVDSTALKKIAITGSLWVIIVAFCGCSLFFFL